MPETPSLQALPPSPFANSKPLNNQQHDTKQVSIRVYCLLVHSLISAGSIVSYITAVKRALWARALGYVVRNLDGLETVT